MIHILPTNDIKEHEETTTCECNPQVEIQDNAEILVIHNAFDGREYFERIEEILDAG